MNKKLHRDKQNTYLAIVNQYLKIPVSKLPLLLPFQVFLAPLQNFLNLCLQSPHGHFHSMVINKGRPGMAMSSWTQSPCHGFTEL